VTARRVVPVRILDAAAEASGCPDLWADARCVLHAIQRRALDLTRVRLDVDRCPSTPMGRALARQWWSDVQRREAEIATLRRHLERMRRDAPGIVAQAEAHALDQGAIWIQVPGGSGADG